MSWIKYDEMIKYNKRIINIDKIQKRRNWIYIIINDNNKLFYWNLTFFLLIIYINAKVFISNNYLMICPNCRCRDIEKTYCPRTRKYVWRCHRCGTTWEIKNDYGDYGGYDDSDDSDDDY